MTKLNLPAEGGCCCAGADQDRCPPLLTMACHCRLSTHDRERMPSVAIPSEGFSVIGKPVIVEYRSDPTLLLPILHELDVYPP
jgi:hypothetical protein